MILNICAILLISSWYLVWPVVVEVVRRESTKEAKYGRMPSRSTTFIPAFRNLNILAVRPSRILSQSINLSFCGAAMNLITYSKVNQPTNTASAISKKSASSAKKQNLIEIVPQPQLGHLRIIPSSSLCWNLGRVEKIRQSVETTTNIQDTTATTWGLVM